MQQKMRQRDPALSFARIAAISGAAALTVGIPCSVKAFTTVQSSPPFITRASKATIRHIYAPPGSGYFTAEDEEDYFPETYEPMMEYPGTMRPGRTPENQAYHDLPIADDDPDPVPWPHFQEIEWHHNWGAPHEHPIPMEEFIELEGRWASVEDEAAMRAGVRRGVRERRELEEMEKAATLIMDDEDDEEEESDSGIRLDLGDGVDALIGVNALTAGDSATKSSTADSTNTKKSSVAEEDEDDDEDDDDFLLDLGLDFNDGDDEEEESKDDDDDDGDEPAFAISSDSTSSLLEAMQSMIDEDDGDDAGDLDDDDADDIDLNLDLGLTDDDTDDDDDVTFDDDDDFGGGGGIQEVSLDDLSQEEDMGDDDSFDDGGFDYE
uniref:Uncharacterized protein n=1 Tax=Ditylum brightwellii TaxID=49249 RepID=A0A7S4V3D8_9STRA